MASSRREKELARMRAERQAARRAAEAARRKQRNTVLASTLAVVLLAVGAAAIALQVRGGGDDPIAADPSASASASPSASPSAAPANAPGTCTYTETDEPAAKPVKALPPPTDVETQKPFAATLTTDRGPVEIELLTAQAPCTVNNFRSLAHFLYFDGTPCHRVTTRGIFVLQCGDPTGTGSGGPGYSFADEIAPDSTYPRGTVAMANGGPGTNGSQFFLVYQDSPLPASYTVFGRVTSGLEVLDAVAAGGAEPEGDGKPKLPINLETVRTRAL